MQTLTAGRLLHRLKVRHLLNTVELALLFMSIAETSRKPDTRLRYQTYAAHAFYTSRHRLLRLCTLSRGQCADVRRKLDQLALRLRRFEEKTFVHNVLRREVQEKRAESDWEGFCNGLLQDCQFLQ